MRRRIKELTSDLLGSVLRRFRAPASRRTFDVRGLRIELDPDADIGRALREKGSFEDREIDIAAALFLGRFQAARAIVDVGANVGIHSLLWARAFPSAPVFAIEPSPATNELLRRNIEQNGLGGRIQALALAICDRDGEVEFFVSEDDAHSSMKDTRRKPVREVIRLPARRLDSLELGHVGLLKIDVEGLERQVISGATALIARDRPILFVEIYGGTHSNPDPEATIAAISAMGYRPYVFARKTGLAPYERHDDKRYNYFFVPS